MNPAASYHERLIEVICENQEVINGGINLLVGEIMNAFHRDNSVWLLGNGGSASTAEHFETDLSLIKFDGLKRYPKVMALTPNSSLITAISNDISYESSFEVLLERRVRSGDLLVAISASGNSKNIINAIEYCKKVNIRTFCLLGFSGGIAKGKSDAYLLVKTNPGEYGIVEDIHLSICHAVSAEIRRRIILEDPKWL